MRTNNFSYRAAEEEEYWPETRLSVPKTIKCRFVKNPASECKGCKCADAQLSTFNVEKVIIDSERGENVGDEFLDEEGTMHFWECSV